MSQDTRTETQRKRAGWTKFSVRLLRGEYAMLEAVCADREASRTEAIRQLLAEEMRRMRGRQ